jgi:DNA mismatch repair protein MSH5
LIDLIDNLNQQMNFIIDFKQSKQDQRIVINQSVDEELDKMKRLYQDLDTLLCKIATQIKLPENNGSSFTIVYFPQVIQH